MVNIIVIVTSRRCLLFHPCIPFCWGISILELVYNHIFMLDMNDVLINNILLLSIQSHIYIKLGLNHLMKILKLFRCLIFFFEDWKYLSMIINKWDKPCSPKKYYRLEKVPTYHYEWEKSVEISYSFVHGNVHDHVWVVHALNWNSRILLLLNNVGNNLFKYEKFGWPNLLW